VLGRLDPNGTINSPHEWRVDQNTGEVALLGDDGTPRLTLTAEDRMGLYEQAGVGVAAALILHSTDGFNWSRENLSDLAGFESFGASRVHSVGNTVLVTVLDRSEQSEQRPSKTVVLVGTPRD